MTLDGQFNEQREIHDADFITAKLESFLVDEVKK